ncbi:MAG: type I methionyl aminopeptidase [Myxococcota bacterium]|nr:type I methionyl aminopeptidase [Myxococcota bacterium]
MGKIGRNDPCWCGSGKKYKKCCYGKLPIGGVQTMSKLLPVKKGNLSPTRLVPAHIVRPSYAETGRPANARSRNAVRTQDEIERMRVAGKVARTVLDTVLLSVRVGITTDELDRIAHEKCIELGAYPSPLNYHHFPKSICTSVNEVICHGIPDDRPLMDGDIVNCDVTVFIEGVHGDCSETVFVGKPDPLSIRLVKTTYECMMKAIEAAKVGATVNAVGKTIAPIAKREGFSIVRDFAGHGIGTQFHQDPQIVHYPDIRQTQKIVPGMTFTVEPMINVGTHRCIVWSDDWTAVTADGKRSAQFEHTVLITKDGFELLTAGTGQPHFMRQLETGWP